MAEMRCGGVVVVAVVGDSCNITFNGGIKNTERTRADAQMIMTFPLRAIHRWVDSSMLPWRWYLSLPLCSASLEAADGRNGAAGGVTEDAESCRLIII